MVASLEFSRLKDAAVLRVHPDGGSWEARSEYTFSAMVFFEDRTAEIKGAARAPTADEYRAIARLFWQCVAIDYVIWESGGFVIVRRRGKGRWQTVAR